MDDKTSFRTTLQSSENGHMSLFSFLLLLLLEPPTSPQTNENIMLTVFSQLIFKLKFNYITTKILLTWHPHRTVTYIKHIKTVFQWSEPETPFTLPNKSIEGQRGEAKMIRKDWKKWWTKFFPLTVFQNTSNLRVRW